MHQQYVQCSIVKYTYGVLPAGGGVADGPAEAGVSHVDGLHHGGLVQVAARQACRCYSYSYSALLICVVNVHRYSVSASTSKYNTVQCICKIKRSVLYLQ